MSRILPYFVFFSFFLPFDFPAHANPEEEDEARESLRQTLSEWFAKWDQKYTHEQQALATHQRQGLLDEDPQCRTLAQILQHFEQENTQINEDALVNLLTTAAQHKIPDAVYSVFALRHIPVDRQEGAVELLPAALAKMHNPMAFDVLTLLKGLPLIKPDHHGLYKRDLNKLVPNGVPSYYIHLVTLSLSYLYDTGAPIDNHMNAALAMPAPQDLEGCVNRIVALLYGSAQEPIDPERLADIFRNLTM